MPSHRSSRSTPPHSAVLPPQLPTLRAVPYARGVSGSAVRLLTDPQRRNLMGISTRLQVSRSAHLYDAGGPAEHVFIVGEGVVKAVRDLPSSRQQITAFLFPGDICGLAENGRFVAGAQAVVPCVVYRLAYSALEDLLRTDPDLQLQFLCKVTHELRESQRQTLMLSRRDAAGRVAMFVLMLARRLGDDGRPGDIPVPMSRTDIASYLGLSLEAVVRACRVLEHHGVLSFPSRHTVQVVNPGRLRQLAASL